MPNSAQTLWKLVARYKCNGMTDIYFPVRGYCCPVDGVSLPFLPAECPDSTAMTGHESPLKAGSPGCHHP